MFKTKKTGGQPRSAADIEGLGNIPPSAYSKAKAEWFERMGSPVVEKGRWFVLALVLAIALAGGVFSFNALLPLKTVTPFLIEVDKLTGEARASTLQAANYKPDEREYRYFAARWIRNLINIDPATAQNLKESYSVTRGTAVETFKDYLDKSQIFAEIKNDPSLRRTTEISSMTFIQEGVLLVRLVTTTRSTRRATEQKRFIVNLNFEIDPPKEEKDILANPIGFYVTHFDFREELK